MAVTNAAGNEVEAKSLKRKKKKKKEHPVNKLDTTGCLVWPLSALVPGHEVFGKEPVAFSCCCWLGWWEGAARQVGSVQCVLVFLRLVLLWL